MDALFHAMADYLQCIGEAGMKKLFDAGVIRKVYDLNSNFVIIDVTLGNVYMTADVPGSYCSVWCEGDKWVGAQGGPDDYSSNLVKIANHEKFMIGFIPWYHAKLIPAAMKSVDSHAVKKTPKTQTNIPFL